MDHAKAPPASGGIPPPPDPADRYPKRHIDVRLSEMRGWTEQEVFLRLGEPDGKSKFDRAPGSGYFGPPKLDTIPPHAPYETWSYHNVERNTWVIYLSDWLEGDPPPAPPDAPKGLIAKLIDSLAGNKTPEATKRPKREKRVVKVWYYGTGAIF